MKAIGRRLLGELDELYIALPALPFGPPPILPGADFLKHVFTVSGDRLDSVRQDTYVESGAAAFLIATSGRTYESADRLPEMPMPGVPSLPPGSGLSGLPPLGGSSDPPDLPFMSSVDWSSADRSPLALSEGRYSLSEIYPVGRFAAYVPSSMDPGQPIGFDGLDIPLPGSPARAGIRAALMAQDPDTLSQCAVALTGVADGLVEVVHRLTYRAQDVRDAPWRGPAADEVQRALQRISLSVRSLAAGYGAVGLLAQECADIVRDAQHGFDVVVNKGGWEVSDVWGGDNDDAREYLGDVNRKLANVIERLRGTEIEISLAGLIPEEARALQPLEAGPAPGIELNMLGRL
ncbi:hypothetical protein [Microtetraspora sp. NBRC 13810]|uniref:WXG100 family type VII secretion target n=1 Tax=Microtetraspora sp. NBRC 13810 TaxID=3030990 RepID=UPI002557BE52|nr:hypothetical protein [Microtetraspora sp. NBRC 13810]